MNTWTMARQWLPFLSGFVGGASLLIGAIIAFDAGRELVGGVTDWHYLTMLVLCAACFLAGGFIILNSALELT